MRRFPLFLVLLLVLSVAADNVSIGDNVSVIESVDSPAQAPIVEDALRVLVDGLHNETAAVEDANVSLAVIDEVPAIPVVEPVAVPEVPESALESEAAPKVLAPQETLVSVPVDSVELVVDSANVTVLEEVVEPAQTPYAEDAVAALANGLAEEAPEVPAEEVVEVPVAPVVEEAPIVEEAPVVDEQVAPQEVIAPPQEEVVPDVNVTPLPPVRNATLVAVPQVNVSELARENVTLQLVDAALSVLDANGNVLRAVVRVTDPVSGSLVAESGRGVSSEVARVPQKPLDVSIELSEGPVREIAIAGALLNLSFIRVDDTPESVVTERSFVQLYAIDPEPLSFPEAEVTVIAKGTSLYKCAEWDFDARSCGGNWTLFKSGLTPGESYTFTMNSSDPAFGEINATAAIHLDASGAFVRDIFPEVVQIDGVWSQPVPAGERVRVTFEHNLTSGNTIDFVARDNGTVSYVDIFVANTSIKVGRSGTGGLAEHQYVELSGVPFPTDTFDLVVVKLIRNVTNDDCAPSEPDCNANSIAEDAMQGFFEFDYIHDAAVTAAGSDGLVAYAETGIAGPRWRQWNTTNSSFSTEQTSANNASAPAAWLVMRSAPRLDQILMGDLDTNTNTSAQVYNGINWTAFQPLAFDSPNTAHRSFDLDYEQLSGRALIVYENSTAVDNAVAYRVFDGTTWGSEQALRTNLSSPVEWIRVVAKVGTNDVMVLLEGTNRNLTAILWNGTGFDNYTQQNITQTGTINDVNEQLFDFVWEGTSGDGLVVWANSSTAYGFRTYNKTSKLWSGANTFFTLNSGAPNGMRLCNDRTSDYAGFVSQDTTDDGNFRIWNGTGVETSPAPPAEAPAIEANGAGAMGLDCAFESQSGRAQFVFINGLPGDDNDYRVCSYNKTAWSNATMLACPLTGVVIGGGNSIEALELFPHPVTNEIMGTAQNFVENFAIVRWNSTAWTNVSTLETSLDCLNGLQTCASFAWSSFDPPPNISIVTPANGTSFIVGATVNITANASDNLNVSLVNASVQLPSGLFLFFNMTRVSGTNLSGIYELNFTTTLTTGTYNFTVVAFDSSGASRNASGNFTVAAAFTNVVVSKTDTPDPVVKGGALSYQINISNTGTVSATLVNMTEIYPLNVVFNSSQPSPSSGNNTFTIGTLAAGASTLINITVNVSSTVANGTILNNTAVVNYTNTSGIRGVNTSILTTVRGIARIFANKSDTPDPVIKGTTLRYVILINNTGDEIAYNVTVTEGYPANVTFNGSSTAPSSGNNTFSLGNILAGGFTTLNITVNVSPTAINGSVLNNSFNVTFANVTGINATATNSTTTTVRGIPFIITAKADSPDPVGAGSTLRYVITVNNTGDEIAYNVSVFDLYPQNVTFNGSDPVPSSGNNTFSIGNLAPSAVFLLNITVNVSPTAPGGSVLNNSYNVTFANLSGSNVTVSNSTTTNVSGTPFIVTSKSDVPDPVVRGATLRYQIVLNNTGTASAFNVTVVESYPANVTFNGSQPSPSSGNNTFVIANISSGAAFLLNITVNVSPTAPNGSILNNSYTVTYANASGQNDSTSNSTTTTVLGIPVIVNVKSDTPDPVVKGQQLNYTILINNTGDEVAYNITVTEVYPFNVSFHNSSPSPSSGNNTFVIGNLSPASSFLINITVNVSRFASNGTILNNSVNATFANLSGVNVTASDFELTTVIGFPELFAAKTDSLDPVPKGTTLTYRIVVNNTGDEIAYNISVFDLYPQNVTFNGSQPAPSSGNNTFSVGNLLPSSSFTINITVNVSPTAPNGSVLNNSFNATFANSSGVNLTITNSTTTTVLGAPVAVSIKSDSPDPVIKGQQLNYTILINNTGDDTAFNVTLLEFYPLGVAFHSAQPTPVGNSTFSIGTLAPSQSFLVNITVNVSAGLTNGTVLVNQVNLSFQNATGNNATVGDSEATTVLGFPTVVTTKTDSPDPVPKGTTLTYRIVVNNTGDEIAYNISVFDLYPQNVTFNGSQPAPSSGNDTFSIGNLLNGTSFTINITVNVSPSAPNGSVLNNSYNLTFANVSGVNLTLTNSTTTIVQGAPFIVNIKSDSPDPVIKGQQLNYSIFINNTGDDTAFNVTVTEVYPAGVSFIASSPTPSSGNGTFNLGNLSPGQSTTINISVTVGRNVANGTVLVNNVNASFTNVSGSGAVVSDSEATTVLGFPELFAAKTDSPDPVPKGTTLTYQIVVNNTGDEVAYNVSVFDLYPQNVTFNGSQPAPSSGNDTFSIGNIQPSSSFVINITLNVSPTAPNGSILTNSFNATFANTSGVNLTITNSTTTTVLGTPFIVNIKSDSPDPVIRGQQLNYSIFINNTGDDTAFNVTVSEVYPSGVSFVTGAPAPSSGNNTFSLGNLSPGQSTVINITVTVGSNVVNGTVLNNSVNASFTNVSGASATVSDNELTTVRGFEVIAVTKTDSPDPVVRGTTLAYQIIVNNTGDEIAYNMTVVDGYPANVTLNSTQPTPTSGNNTFAIGNLLNGSSFVINITVNVSSAISNGTVLNNTVNTSWANLSGSNGINQTYQETTVVNDTFPPLVFDVRPIADTAFQEFQLVEIAANVTDNVAVDNVTANVTYPNGTILQVNLTRIAGTDKYNASFITPALNGQYNITFIANDTEGNVNSTVTTFFRVVGDILFPIVVFISPTPANNTYQNTTFIPVNITVTEANLSLAWVELNGSRVNFTQPAYNATNQSTLTYVVTGTPQSHFVYIGDNVSHANLSTTFTISVGTMDVIVNGNLIGTIGTGDTSPKNFTNIEQFLVIGTNNITYDPTVAVTATVSQSNINYTALNNSFGNNYTGLSDGVYSFFGAANDSTGNENTTGNRTVTIDTLSPLLVFVSPTETSGSTVARRNVFVNVSVNDTNFANVTISLFNSTGGLVNSSVYVTSSAFANFSGLPDGFYYFNATAFDLATNNNYSETRNVTVKANPPNVSILSPADASIYYVNDTVNVTANVSDYVGVGTVLVQITYPDGSLENFTTDQSGSLYNLTFTNLTLRGNYTVTIIANDTLGNINNTIIRTFIRRSLNVIDITNRTGGLLNYTLMVTGNVSGVLNLSANISGKRVKQMNLTVHNESSVYSIFRIDDEMTAAEAPNGSFVEYAIDPTGINFTSAAITVTAIGDFMLYTCKNYNFSDQVCLGSWEENQSIRPGVNYTIFMTPTDPGFLETSSAVDVAMAPLSNTSFVIAFVDNNLSTVSFRIMNTTGSVILNTTTLDGTADNTSRVDVAIINSTHFVIMWVDGPSDNLTQQLFLYNGTNTSSPTVVRAAIGLNTDVKLASTADRYIACYANDATNAANFITFFNNGSQDIAELAADADIAPAATLQNLVGCAGVTSTNWTYFWFDDANNDATFSVFNTTGGSQTGQVDIDLNVGETGQVAISAIGNDTFGLLYYDLTTTTINVAIRYINNTVRAAPIVMDADAGAISRVSAGTVKRNETSTEDLFVISWWDSTSGDIKAAVLNASGANVTAAFTVESQPNTTFRLLDVMGSVPISNTSICPGRFLVAYTNSSGAGVFKGFFANGSSWNGTCDLFNPLVFDVRPINNTVYNTSDIIEIAANVTDDVAVDTVLANITFPNGTVQTLTLTLVPATNKYNASFAIPITGQYNVSFFANDTEGNVNNTESTVFFAVFVAPQLSATKTDSPDPVPKGTQLNYQITVNNSGNGTAFNITVIEGYPSGVIFHNSSPSPTSGNNTFVIGNVTNGSSFTINITVNVSVSVANGSVLNNSFNLSYNNQSGNNLSVTNSTTTTVLGAPFILSIKSDTPDPVVKGQQLNYTIFVNNTGDDTAFNVTVVDTYPAGVVFVSSSPVPSIGNGTFNLGNLSPNQSTTINITVNVSRLLANGTVLSNLANASFSNSSGANSSASDTELTTVIGFAEVFTNKSDSPDPVIRGQPLSYQILINNTGDEIAYNVTVVESYPANVTFNNSSPSPTSGNGTFVIASIQPNSSTTINITVNVSSAAPNGSILNNSYNLTFANNSGVNLTITNSTTTTVQGAAQITTVKVDSPDPVVKGQQLNYTITVNNTGDDIAFNVTLVDVYPSGVVFVSSSPSPSSGNNTFSLGNFSPNSSTTINITVNVSRALANGTILSNVANVSFQNSSGGNLTSLDTETTTVLGFPEVNTNKTDSPDPVFKGQTLRYQILINNTGDEIAYNVTVIDLYPQNVTLNSTEPAPFSGNNTFVIPVVGANSSFFINITVNVSASAPNGSILNNSYNLTFANSSGVNSTFSNSTTTLVLGSASILVAKSDAPDPVVKGQQLNYTINLTNTGDDTAFNVTLVDVYPSGVVFVSSSPSPTSGNNTFSVGNFSPNQSTTINITVNVSAGVANGSVLSNFANVSFQNSSGGNLTSFDTETTTVLGFPDLSVTVVTSPTPANINSTLTYIVTFNNTGDEIAYNSTFVIGYPANVTFNGSVPAPTFGNNTFVIPFIQPNSSSTIIITVNVSFFVGNGTVFNTTYNTTFANVSGTNLTLSNSTLTTVTGVALLAVAKVDSIDPIMRGSLLNYTINVTNYDGETAYNVTVVETYPANVSFVSSSPAPSSGNNTFSIGGLLPLSSFLVNVTVNVSPLLPNGTVLVNAVNVTFANASGQNASVNTSESTTVLSDTGPVVASVFPSNQTNTTNTTLSFSFNATDDVSSSMNCSFNLNGTLAGTNSSVQNGTIANFSASGLSQGNRTWAVSCTDASNNTNATETRIFTVDFTPPDFLNLLFMPQDNNSLDPGVLMNFTANVTDNFSAVNRSSVVLHVFFANGTSVANITFDVNDTNGGWNGTFIPLAVGNYTAYLTALDSTGNNGTSPAVNFTIDYEASWTRSPTTFGAFSAVGGQNVSLGNLTINNTGDFNLSFVLNSSLNATFFNESNFSLAPGQVRLVAVNATAPSTVGAFPHNVSINATSANVSYPANPAQQNTSFTITTVDDAFLFASFFLIPSEVTRGQSGVSIIAQVTNSGSRNASNVTLNITLPPDWVLTGGGLSTFFGTIEPNQTEQLPIIVQIPSSATLGLRDVMTATDGFNDSGVQLSTLNLTQGTTAQVLVKAAPGFGGPGGGSGGGGGGAGAGAGGGGGGPSGSPFLRTHLERPTLVTNAWIEVLRGTKIVFPLEIFNYYENTVMTRVDLDVDSYLKRYVHWSPDFLMDIPFEGMRSFEVELDAPLYQEKADIKIPFIITYKLKGVIFEDTPFGRVARQIEDTIVEYKTLTVHIREATKEQIEEFATDIERLYNLVVKNEYPTRRADALKALLAREVAADDYEEAAYLSSKLKLLLERELDAGGLIGRLRDQIARMSRQGFDTAESERILALAVKAFEREDFDRAIELADSALSISAIESEGAFDPFAFIVSYWWALALFAGALGVAGRVGYRVLLVKRLEHKLDDLLRERIEVHKLQRDAQDAYFVRRELGGLQFNAAMRQYQKRLERMAVQAGVLRMRRAALLPFRKAVKVAQAELRSAEQAIRDAQEAYFVKRMISRRRYELRIEVLRVLVGELELHVALLKKRVKP